MDDRSPVKDRDRKLKKLREKIRDPIYLQQAVSSLAGNLAKEYYLRTQR